MPARQQSSNAQQAFDADTTLCARCDLRFREYHSGLAILAEQTGVPQALPPEAYFRLPLCRSSVPFCEGMRGLLAMRFGRRAADVIMVDASPLVLH